MTKEEAKAYFMDSNKRIISVAKDENRYNYETQQIEDAFMRRDFEAKEMAIEALEQTRWIPVSEKLPKASEYIGNVRKYYLIQDEYGDMHVAHLNKVGWIPMDSLKAIGNEVIAWCELPGPYKAESENCN